MPLPADSLAGAPSCSVCRRIDNLVAIAHRDNVGKARRGEVHPGNQQFFAGGLGEDLFASDLRLSWIDVKGDAYVRMRGLNIREMDDVTPDKQALTV